MTKRKGFTLVELLIVVVIIGVLASMMAVSSSESIDAADAASIIGNLSTMKKAAFATYITSRDEVASITYDNLKAAVANYVGIKTASLKSFDVAFGTTVTENWYVLYDTGGSANTKVQTALKAKAGKIGLLGSSAAPSSGVFSTVPDTEYTNERYVILKVF